MKIKFIGDEGNMRESSCVVITLICIMLAGCFPSPVFTELNTDLQIKQESGKEHVLLINGPFSLCPASIADKIRSEKPKWQAFTEDEFREILYPWLEKPESGPNALESNSELKNLLSNPLIEQRIKDFDISAAVHINNKTTGGGSDDTTFFPDYGDMHLPTFFCVGGAPGGGCFRLALWERKSETIAELLALPSGKYIGKISVTTSGEAVAVGFVMPAFFIPPIETVACRKLAKEIIYLLSNSDSQ